MLELGASNTLYYDDRALKTGDVAVRFIFVNAPSSFFVVLGRTLTDACLWTYVDVNGAGKVQIGQGSDPVSSHDAEAYIEASGASAWPAGGSSGTYIGRVMEFKREFDRLTATLYEADGTTVVKRVTVAIPTGDRADFGSGSSGYAGVGSAIAGTQISDYSVCSLFGLESGLLDPFDTDTVTAGDYSAVPGTSADLSHWVVAGGILDPGAAIGNEMIYRNVIGSFAELEVTADVLGSDAERADMGVGIFWADTNKGIHFRSSQVHGWDLFSSDNTVLLDSGGFTGPPGAALLTMGLRLQGGVLTMKTWHDGVLVGSSSIAVVDLFHGEYVGVQGYPMVRKWSNGRFDNLRVLPL